MLILFYGLRGVIESSLVKVNDDFADVAIFSALGTRHNRCSIWGMFTSETSDSALHSFFFASVLSLRCSFQDCGDNPAANVDFTDGSVENEPYGSDLSCVWEISTDDEEVQPVFSFSRLDLADSDEHVIEFYRNHGDDLGEYPDVSMSGYVAARYPAAVEMQFFIPQKDATVKFTTSGGSQGNTGFTAKWEPIQRVSVFEEQCQSMNSVQLFKNELCSRHSETVEEKKLHLKLMPRSHSLTGLTVMRTTKWGNVANGCLLGT